MGTNLQLQGKGVAETDLIDEETGEVRGTLRHINVVELRTPFGTRRLFYTADEARVWLENILDQREHFTGGGR